MVVSTSNEIPYLTEVNDGCMTILSDVAEDKGGGSKGMRPHDLLCAGLASCMNMTARMVLERKGLPYEKVIVKVDLDRSDEESTVFLYDVDIVGDISEDKKNAVKEILINCPVSKTLRKQIRVKNNSSF
mgnify:CR=1 FL=1